MIMKYLRLFAFACIAALIGAVHAHAQVQSQEQPIVPTTAIEVALVYHKLMDAEPDFAGYVQSNKSLQERENPALRRVLMRQQEKLLRDIYASINKETMIYAKPRILITAMEMNQNYAGLSQRNLTAPIQYTLDNGETYGVVIRNAREALMLRPPLVTGDFSTLYSNYVMSMRNIPMEMVLRPVLADPEEHVDNEGQKYKVLAADLLELRIRNVRDGKLLLVKRFLNWDPEKPSVLKEAIKENNINLQQENNVQKTRPQAPPAAGGGSGGGGFR